MGVISNKAEARFILWVLHMNLNISLITTFYYCFRSQTVKTVWANYSLTLRYNIVKLVG